MIVRATEYPVGVKRDPSTGAVAAIIDNTGAQLNVAALSLSPSPISFDNRVDPSVLANGTLCQFYDVAESVAMLMSNGTNWVTQQGSRMMLLRGFALTDGSATTRTVLASFNIPAGLFRSVSSFKYHIHVDVPNNARSKVYDISLYQGGSLYTIESFEVAGSAADDVASGALVPGGLNRALACTLQVAQTFANGTDALASSIKHVEVEAIL